MKLNAKKSDGSVIDLLYDEFYSGIENKSRLIVFHGSDRSVNSILCRQLFDKVQDDNTKVSALVDLKIPSNREIDGLLISLRNHFNKKFNAVFPSFDIACAYYLYKTNSGLSPLNDNYPLHNGKGPLKSVAKAVSGLPVKSFIPVLEGIFTTPGSRYKQWWLKRGKIELVNISYLEPEQILMNLSGLWIEDLCEFVSSNGTEAVVFLDSFENLLSENDSDGSGLYSGFIVKCLQRIDDIRFVAMSDTEQEKEIKTDGIPFSVKNIPLNAIIEIGSTEFLKQSGIVGGELAAYIEKQCAGIPHLLNLAIDIHGEIINVLKREPRKSDFKSLDKNARVKLFAVLNEEELGVLKILSCAVDWDADMFLLLVKKFGKGYSQEKMKAILRFSFVTESGTGGFYTINEDIKQILLTDDDSELIRKVNGFLFEYHDRKLKTIDYNNITDNDKENFRSAFHYAGKVMGGIDFAQWSSAYFDRFRETGRYRFILPFLNEVKEVIEKENIDDSKELADVLRHEGICYKEIGKYKDSERLLNRAVRIFEKLYGKDSREVAGCILNLADVLFCQGEFSKAEPLYLKSIVLHNPLEDKEGTFSVVSMINLAILFARQGNYEKAVSLFEKILNVRLKSHGEEHPDVHRIQTNIANIEFERKNHQKAESLYRKILHSKKSFYGDYHPEVGKAMINLGNVLIELGNYGETITLYEKAKEIFEDFYGKEHPDYAMTLNNLAYLNFLTGNYATSKIFYLQALDIYKNILGDEHPDLAILYNNIGTLYTRMKEFGEAESFLKKSLEIKIKKFGFDKPDTGNSYKSLAEFNESIGNVKDALFYYEKFETILKTHFPEDNPDLKYIREKIAFLKNQ